MTIMLLNPVNIIQALFYVTFQHHGTLFITPSLKHFSLCSPLHDTILTSATPYPGYPPVPSQKLIENFSPHTPRLSSKSTSRMHKTS